MALRPALLLCLAVVASAPAAAANERLEPVGFDFSCEQDSDCKVVDYGEVCGCMASSCYTHQMAIHVRDVGRYKKRLRAIQCTCKSPSFSTGAYCRAAREPRCVEGECRAYYDDGGYTGPPYGGNRFGVTLDEIGGDPRLAEAHLKVGEGRYDEADRLYAAILEQHAPGGDLEAWSAAVRQKGGSGLSKEESDALLALQHVERSRHNARVMEREFEAARRDPTRLFDLLVGTRKAQLIGEARAAENRRFARLALEGRPDLLLDARGWAPERVELVVDKAVASRERKAAAQALESLRALADELGLPFVIEPGGVPFRFAVEGDQLVGREPTSDTVLSLARRDLRTPRRREQAVHAAALKAAAAWAERAAIQPIQRAHTERARRTGGLSAPFTDAMRASIEAGAKAPSGAPILEVALDDQPLSSLAADALALKGQEGVEMRLQVVKRAVAESFPLKVKLVEVLPAEILVSSRAQSSWQPPWLAVVLERLQARMNRRLRWLGVDEVPMHAPARGATGSWHFHLWENPGSARMMWIAPDGDKHELKALEFDIKPGDLEAAGDRALDHLLTKLFLEDLAGGRLSP